LGLTESEVSVNQVAKKRERRRNPLKDVDPLRRKVKKLLRQTWGNHYRGGKKQRETALPKRQKVLGPPYCKNDKKGGGRGMSRQKEENK